MMPLSAKKRAQNQVQGTPILSVLARLAADAHAVEDLEAELAAGVAAQDAGRAKRRRPSGVKGEDGGEVEVEEEEEEEKGEGKDKDSIRGDDDAKDEGEPRRPAWMQPTAGWPAAAAARSRCSTASTRSTGMHVCSPSAGKGDAMDLDAPIGGGTKAQRTAALEQAMEARWGCGGLQMEPSILARARWPAAAPASNLRVPGRSRGAAPSPLPGTAPSPSHPPTRHTRTIPSSPSSPQPGRRSPQVPLPQRGEGGAAAHVGAERTHPGLHLSHGCACGWAGGGGGWMACAGVHVACFCMCPVWGWGH
jgi:hypothetical protein